MVLGKLPVPAFILIWIIAGQRPTALTVGAGGCCLDIFFSHLLFLSSFFLTVCLWGGGVRRCWVNFQYWGVLLIWNIVEQGSIVLSVGAGGGCMDIFSSSVFSLFFLPLWESPIKTEILSQRAVKPNTTNQPTLSLGDGPI